MPTAARRPAGQPRLSAAHSSGVSRQRARNVSHEIESSPVIDSPWPEPEVVSGIEKVAALAQDSSELDRLRQQVVERDLLIEALTTRVASLEGELDRARQALMNEQVMIDPAKPASSVERGSDATSSSGLLAAERPPMDEPDEPRGFPVLSRVSVALREGVSLPPPSRPDAVPPSRRREPRRACELELEFTDETHFYAGITQDLSQGGVFIATYRVFPVGSRLELGFQLPNGTEVRARGVVRWVRGEGAPEDERPGMGVAFTELSDSALAAIADFCRERAPLYMEI